ncbi:MAG TPA: histidine kinase [Gaiellaceae bacterium]|nr:histidine kinase [Gaiellaceae bacterium]
MEETERALLAERMLAEQEERRRLAEALHDGPVQQLSAIAQMLDTAVTDLQKGDAERAVEVVTRSLELAREAARDVRGLCDDLEPSILHQLGFASAVGALARRISSRHHVEVELDVAHGDELGENAAVALYQLLREAMEQAVRRGPLSKIEVTLRPSESDGIELVVIDDGPPERRAAVLEALAERAATLNGRFSSEVRYPRGSTLRVDLPPAAAHR